MKLRRHSAPREIREGSWAEALLLTLMTFQIVIVPLLAIVLVLGLVGLTIWMLATRPFLAIIPVAIIFALMWWFTALTKEAEGNLEDDLVGPGRRL